MNDQALQKRKEREERRAAEAIRAAAAANPDKATGLFIPTPDTPQVAPSQTSNTPGPGPTSIPYTVVIPGSSAASFEWYNPAFSTYSTIASARAAGIWDYPSTLNERAKCGVFRGLWEQGYFMGGGIKFGGDYLVYPGMCFTNPTPSAPANIGEL